MDCSTEGGASSSIVGKSRCFCSFHMAAVHKRTCSVAGRAGKFLYLQSGFLKRVFDQKFVVVFTILSTAPGFEVILGHMMRWATYKYCGKAPLPDFEIVARLVRDRSRNSSVELAPISMTHGMRLKSISTTSPGSVQTEC